MIDAPPRQRGRFVVVGLGRVGRMVVSLLRRLGAEVTVVTARTRDDWLEDAREQGATVFLGDGRDGRLLAKAGIDRADALVVATDGDLVNLEIALDARRIRADLPIVARIFDQTLARHVEGSLGLRRALGVSNVAAPVFAAASLGERVAGAFVLDDVPMVLGLPERGNAPSLEPRDDWARRLAVKIPPRRRPPGRLVEAVRFVRRVFGNAPRGLRAIGAVLLFLVVTSVAVFHFALGLSVIDAVYFVVTTVTTTGYGDITARGGGLAIELYACLLMLLGSASTAVLYSFVTDFIVSERVEGLTGRVQRHERDHVIVAGMGEVGNHVCAELARTGVPFVVLDRSASAEHAEADRAGGTFLVGDARVATLLDAAAVTSARAIVAVTGDDAVNLGIALEAKVLNPKLRAVVRLFDPELARKVEHGMGIDAVMSASAIAAPTFVASALYSDAFAATALADVLVVLREIHVTDAHAGFTAAQVAAAAGGTAMLYAPPKGAFLAVTAEARLESGGRLVVTVREKLAPAGIIEAPSNEARVEEMEPG
ncbi:TrkA-N domain protein [Minicystis rosea]|nr:TrkA-N domain protein [Minicystis rosea]